MTRRIAILTPDPASEGYQTRWRDVLDRNAEPLRAAGYEVAGRAWVGSTDLAEFDLVLPLLVWGYPFVPEQWAEAVGRWEAEGVRLQNPPSVLRWNADKSYLGTLAGRGAPVVPTLYGDRLSNEELEEAARQFRTTELVAKPRISSSGWQTIRWTPGASIEDGPAKAAMIQPYLRDIETGGEVSLFYFGGRYSHAVSKRPQPGEFRVQPEFHGIIRAYQPARDEFEAAERILAAVEEQLLYARVDLVRGLSGDPQLIELELIEPDLYLSYDAKGGEHFASAVAELIGSQPL